MDPGGATEHAGEPADQGRTPASFPRSDVEAIVSLLGRAIASDEPLAARRATIFAGLAVLIDADVWCWIQSRYNPGAGLPVPLNILEGGWRDDAERSAFLNANYDEAFNKPILAALEGGRRQTLMFEELFRPGQHDELVRFWRESTGLCDCILCCHPLGNESWSNVGFHRRVGRPRFGPRERGLAELLLSQLDFLHRPGVEVPANAAHLYDLSPRERHALIHLLGGCSAKEIAGEMKLSVHTVNGYIRNIYRRIGVNSRPELMRLFMSGGHSPTPASASAERGGDA